MALIQLHRAERGHDFLPDELAATLPRLYSSENISPIDNIVRVRYFIGNASWWITEYDPIEERAFGFATLGDDLSAEWGYVSLNELEQMHIDTQLGIPVYVERDILWTPKTVRDGGIPSKYHREWWSKD